jgi:ribonucleotide reductase beta subunit family protein with ferritin-like domain
VEDNLITTIVSQEPHIWSHGIKKSMAELFKETSVEMDGEWQEMCEELKIIDRTN